MAHRLTQGAGLGSVGAAALRQKLLLALSVSALAAMATGALALVEEPFVAPVVEEPADGTAADFSAEKLIYDPATQTAIATGKVVMTYGPYTLTASKVTYNQKTGKFTANGSVVLREPNGNVLQAAQIEVTNKFRDAFARHLTALLTNNATIIALYARRTEGRYTVFEQASYTACRHCATNSGDPLWELVADETLHDQEARTLYHHNPKFRIGGVTVAALPYLEHADPTVKRRSGWLWPSVKYGEAYGVSVVTPYFLELGPDKDLTFRPMWSWKQALVADVEFRQRTRNGLYSIRGYGVHEIVPSDSPEVDGPWRGALTSKGDFEINEDWSWGWNGTIASDRDFLDDYDFDDSEIAKNEVFLKGLWDRNYVSASLLGFASLDETVDPNHMPVALPYAKGEHYLEQEILGGELNFNWSVYSLYREEAYTPFTDVNHGTSQTRAMAELRWKSRFIGDAGQLVTPFAALRSDLYMSQNVPDPDVPGGFRADESVLRVLPAVGLDVRWPWISSYASGQGIVSPVFQLIAAGDEQDQEKIGNEDAITLNFDHTSLFLEDRFTGYDRYEAGVRANLGITYSFLGDNGGVLKASIGESFHIAGENSFATGSGLDGSKSDLVAALMFQPWDNLSLSYNARIEEDLSAINRQELIASLSFDRIAVNAGYLNIAAEPAYGRPTDEEWVEGDARIGLSESWYLFGGARYDIERSKFTAKTIGLEFDCDCMNFKLAYTEAEEPTTADTERKLMMSIDFATLGGTNLGTRF